MQVYKVLNLSTDNNHNTEDLEERLNGLQKEGKRVKEVIYLGSRSFIQTYQIIYTEEEQDDQE